MKTGAQWKQPAQGSYCCYYYYHYNYYYYYTFIAPKLPMLIGI